MDDGISGKQHGGSQQQIVRRLRERLSRWTGGARREDRQGVSTGCTALDRMLPGRRLARGTLVEWLEAEQGGGAAILALVVAREAVGACGRLVVVDRPPFFYPVAAEQWGIDMQQMVVIRPQSVPDERWALEQVLRAADVAAVLACPEHLDPTAFRRLQLAAEKGGALGLLVRPDRARREASWADVRWRVAPRPCSDGAWVLGVELLRVRGGPAARRVEVRIDETAGTLHEADSLRGAAPLARPTAVRRQAGA